MLPVGEDEDMAAWLGVPVSVCAVECLLKGCGEVVGLIHWQCQ